MRLHLFWHHLWLGLATQLLLHSPAMAQSAPVQDELNRISAVFKIIQSDYVAPVAESDMATACRDGILRVASTQSSGTIAQAKKLELDTNSLPEVLRLIPFLVEKSPNIDSARQFGDGCLHSMLQALDPRSAYFDQKEFEKFRNPPPPVGSTTVPKGLSEPPVEKDVARDAAVTQVVSFKTPDGKYLYLRISRLNANTFVQLGSILRAMEPGELAGLSGMVLDLRKNPGGVLTAAVGVAATFLPTTSVVAKTVGRNGLAERYFAEPRYYGDRFTVEELFPLPAVVKTLPLLVLVSRKTEAGAEAIAIALQDNKRAKIIGEQTLGYGTVQTFRPLGRDTGFKFTTSKLVRPNGDEWNRKGVTPDHLTVQKVREGVELGSKEDAEFAEALQLFGTQ